MAHTSRIRAAVPLGLAFAVLTGASVLLPACGNDIEPNTAHHVLLITCDTLRADRLGVYGAEHETTPALNRFAMGSQVFERAYSSAPMTLPSVCSMLTGQLPIHTGVVNNFNFLHKNANTLAEELSSHGIVTAAVVSNWVLLNPPNMPDDFGVEQGFEHFDGNLPGRERNRGMPERNARDTTDAAIEWLTSQTAKGERPFFLWVHYQDPHGPYTAPAHFVEMMKRDIPDQPIVPFATDTNGRGGIPTYQRLDDEQRPEAYRVQYDAEVRYFDFHVGRLLDYLEQSDLLREALVLFSADHGESLGEHDYWFCHGESLNHELVHVPLLIRPPGTRTVDGGAAPRREARIASQLDIWPTVMEGFGLDPGSGPGSSLLGPESRSSDHNPVAVQVFAKSNKGPARASVVDATHRLLLRNGKPVRLFDRQEDPGEFNNVLQEQPEIAERLLERYLQLAQPGAASLPQDSQRSLSEEEQRILEGLGYSGSDEDD